MSDTWVGRLRHGLWQCNRCLFWWYWRTGSTRLDSSCRKCGYRARCVLDRRLKGGRRRQIRITEYPAYRPPATIRIEQKRRNLITRAGIKRNVEADHADINLDVFTTAGDRLRAKDQRDIERHGCIFRFEPQVVGPSGRWRDPHDGGTGDSKWRLIKVGTPEFYRERPDLQDNPQKSEE